MSFDNSSINQSADSHLASVVTKTPTDSSGSIFFAVIDKTKQLRQRVQLPFDQIERQLVQFSNGVDLSGKGFVEKDGDQNDNEGKEVREPVRFDFAAIRAAVSTKLSKLPEE